MRTQLVLAAALLAAVFALGGGSSGSSKPALPRAEPAFPNGCVGCHAKSADGDHRLGAVLAKMKHPAVAMVKTVPNDCLKCHRAQKPPFSQMIHKAHFGGDDFEKKFKGDCTHCHSMNGKTGVVTNKSGPKNW